MSTMIRFHTMEGLTQADVDCFFDYGSRRHCTEPRREGSFYDSDVMNRIIAGRGDGTDPRPCGHHAAVEEGDRVELGDDMWEPHNAVSKLFGFGGETRTLTPELRDEILTLISARVEYDSEIMIWLEEHLGQEIFRIHW